MVTYKFPSYLPYPFVTTKFQLFGGITICAGFWHIFQHGRWEKNVLVSISICVT